MRAQQNSKRLELIDGATLRRLCTASNAAGALQVFSHVGAIAMSGTWLWLVRSTWWSVPAFLVHGICINFLYAGQHELSHSTVFRTRALNEWVGRAFGFLLFYPRTFDQVQHMAHHRYTQDWTRDGELERPRYTLASYLLWMSGVTYWYTRWLRLARFTAGHVSERYLPPHRYAELIREARWHVVGYALIIGASVIARSWAAVLLWFAPMIAMKGAHQLQNTIEHLGLSHTDDILENTRSTRTNAVMRWLCWQMQYHTAHHAFPAVPFHCLRELHETLFDAHDRSAPSMTYWGFQAAVVRALSGGRTEADYPDDVAWIADLHGK